MGGAVISRVQRIADDRILHRDVVEVLLGEEVFDEAMFNQLAMKNRTGPEENEGSDFITGQQLKLMVERRNASLSMSYDSAADVSAALTRSASVASVPAEEVIVESQEEVDHCALRVINFDKFEKLGRLPRYPDDASVCVPIDTVDKDCSLVVYICHNWLRSTPESSDWNGQPHPDDKENNKFKLCTEGLRVLREKLAPGMRNLYLWMDFGCLNQQFNPIIELPPFPLLFGHMDCLFSPVVGLGDVPNQCSSMFDAYHAHTWNEGPTALVNRAWCRIECFFSANVRVEVSRFRLQRMAAGLKNQSSNGIRPHFVYGDRESLNNLKPLLLPPLQNSHLSHMHPCSGHVTKSSDMSKIEELSNELAQLIKPTKSGYRGIRNKDGKMHGHGIYTWPSGKIYEGEYENGQQHGTGIFKNAAGDIYEGHFEKGKFHGSGKMKWVNGDHYDGEWRDGKQHGHGVFDYAGGDKYDGEWKNGNQHGQGILNYINGSCYEGEWKDGKRSGEGKFTWPNGDVYTGRWVDGMKHGEGKLRDHTGNVYKGEFLSDKKNGKGRFKYTNGNIYEGEVVDGIPHGKGKITFPNGDVYNGDFKMQKRTGKGTFLWANGNAYTGDWQDGIQCGVGKFTWSSGDTYEGQWVNGKQHGQGKFSHVNGNCYEGEWMEGKKHGKGNFTWASGAKYAGDYALGKQTGKAICRWPNGDEFEGEFENGEIHGKGVFRWMNGDYVVGTWVRGKQHGTGKLVYASGSEYEKEWYNGIERF